MRQWLGVLLLPLLCGASFAQTSTYPDRPITLIVTAAAGGVTDVAARAVGQELTKAWGQPVIVENRGGAAHILGAQSVAKADPDGYTLMVGEAGTFTINPTIYPPGKLPYDTDRDFVPISGLVRINQALIADNNLPAANAAELIALAKQKPGQLTYGTAGIGSAPHMNIALFENMAGVKLQAGALSGAAPALNDLASGSINLMSVSVSLALPAFRAAGSRCSASAAKNVFRRRPISRRWRKAACPAIRRSPGSACSAPPVAARHRREAQHPSRKDFRRSGFSHAFLEPQMFEAMPGSPEEFAAYIQSDRAKWAKVIHEATSRWNKARGRGATGKECAICCGRC